MKPQAPPPTRRDCLEQMASIIKTVNDHAGEINRRWGYNRLPHIVPIDWTLRFKEQKRRWELACFECAGSPLEKDISRVKTQGEAMLRAFAKLEEIAIESGKAPAPPGTWEFELEDGTPVTLTRTAAERDQLQTDHAGQVWSLDEIGRIIAKFPELVMAKAHFPMAEVIQMKTSKKVEALVDDELSEIPFG